MKQISSILIGAGLRGGYVYSQYALDHPDELRVVAVAEPDRVRREIFAKKHNIPKELQFESYEDILQMDKIADCAMVCTQDRMHYEPVVMALEKGYHVLCEKPMSPNKEEIINMRKMAKKYNRILSVCHVLRYSDFFSKIKSLLEEEKIGKLVTIQHIEEVGYWHHAHSFVRGNWRNFEESSPMILQKCCHDMDILLWLAQSRCKSISSFGSLTYFKKENAPVDAPKYCMDGCSKRDDCPYYAPKFYLEHPKAIEDGLIYAVTDDLDNDKVLNALKKGPYGRCVFHSDNTVVDHQTVNIEFDNGVKASFLMTAFTNRCARRIRLMGTMGEIIGDMESGLIEVIDFVSGSNTCIKLNTKTKGHSGSDTNIMRDFVSLIRGERVSKTGADISVESHLMALAAEEARVKNTVVDFKKFIEE